jgi:hypothetical protein
MPNLPIATGLALTALLTTLPATAAEFAVKDLSGTETCLPEEFWEGLLATFPSAARCYPQPVGTIEIVITPAAGELPVECHDNGQGGQFCMYAADVVLAARYQNQWYAKTTSYSWTPADDLSQLPAASHWAPWGETASLSYQFYVSPIDLNTSQFVALPEGTEVYVGIAPAGTRSFTAKTVAKIWPVSKP